MLKYRAVSFPLLLALLAATVFWNPGGEYLFFALGTAAFGMLLYEFCTMLAGIGRECYPRATAGLGGLFFLLAMLSCRFRWQSEWLDVAWAAAMTAMICSGWIAVLFCGGRREVLSRALRSSGVFLWTLVPMFFLATVYFDDRLKFLFLVLTTKMMDTGGYVFGMLSARWMKNGNHKILPKISPKKSWEGTVGGLLFSMTAALLFYRFAPGGLSLSWHLAAGFVLGLGSLAGDLTESALKRTCGVKDSGRWIPGMGGAFDVLDSFLYNGLLLQLLLLAAW